MLTIRKVVISVREPAYAHSNSEGLKQHHTNYKIKTTARLNVQFQLDTREQHSRPQSALFHFSQLGLRRRNKWSWGPVVVTHI